MIALLLLTLGQADLQAAVADAERIGPSAAQARYVSLSAVHPIERPNVLMALRLTLNLVSRTALIVQPVDVGGGLFRIDVARAAPQANDYREWLAAWEKLVERDPYYHQRIAATAQGKRIVAVTDGGWLDLAAARRLREATGSQGALLRADWWVREALTSGAYYSFAGIPSTLAAYERKLGLDEGTVRSLRAALGANLRRSGVTDKPRRLVRWPVPTGALWFTYDQADDTDPATDPFRDPRLGSKFDAGELIVSRPNQLHEYSLWDGAGARLEVADAAVAVDYSVHPPEELRPGVSCIRCHFRPTEEGLRSFTDLQAGLMAKTDLLTRTAEEAEELAAVYTRQARLAALLERDREDHVEAVRRATGKSPAEMGEVLASVLAVYEGLVDVERAKAELGVDDLGALRDSTDPIAQFLVGGESVTRGQFESSFGGMALLIEGAK